MLRRNLLKLAVATVLTPLYSIKNIISNHTPSVISQPFVATPHVKNIPYPKLWDGLVGLWVPCNGKNDCYLINFIYKNNRNIIGAQNEKF